MRLRGSMCTGNREDVVLCEKLHTIQVQWCVCVSDILSAEEGGEELLIPCLFWLSVFFKTLSWSQLRASS